MASSGQTRLPPEKVDCRWWKQGYCFRGTKCFFKHNPALIGVDAPKSVSNNEKSKNKEEQDNATSESHTKDKTKQRLLYKPSREPCGICYETPEVYGLLTQCDHVFCLDCIREWRNSSRKTASSIADSELVATTKTCPVCRTKSDFVVPSSAVPVPQPKRKSGRSSSSSGSVKSSASSTNPAKKELVENYLQQRKRIPCKYYQASVDAWRSRRENGWGRAGSRSGYADDRRGRDEWDGLSGRRSGSEGVEEIPFRPRCKFGNDCHYAHIHPLTGKPHIFTQSELGHMQSRHRGSRSLFLSDRVIDDSIGLWSMFHDEGARMVIESVNRERRELNLSPIALSDQGSDRGPISPSSLDDDWDTSTDDYTYWVYGDTPW